MTPPARTAQSLQRRRPKSGCETFRGMQTVDRRIITSRLFAIALALFPVCVTAQGTPPPKPIRADYANPTDRYPHNIMGRLNAHTDLIVTLDPCPDCGTSPITLAIRLPTNLVFEDFAPRLIDLNSDGRHEIITVESDQSKGSRLAVWEVIQDADQPRLIRSASTDFIGTRFRWLAPIGAADFNGDGTVEIAYVEKPHLDKILHIVRRDGTRLKRIASVAGVTNHAIGQEEVQSRIELCDGIPTIFALDASGERLLSIRMKDGAAEVTPRAKVQTPHRLDDTPLCNR